MLTRDRLLELDRDLRDTLVLSVYLDGTHRDPAARAAWRTKLDNALAEVRASVEQAPHAEREAFARAVANVNATLASLAGAPSGGGWIAFATERDVVHTTSVAVPLPTCVTWQRGLRIAPYACATAEQQSALVVVVDHRRAQVYRLADARLERVDAVHAHAEVGPVYHMGDAPAPGFHGGVRGSTGTDESQRTLREGLRRMLAETVERVLTLCRPAEFVVVGGTPQAARALASQLEEYDALRQRVVCPVLSVWSTEAEIARAAGAASAELRDRRLLAEISKLVDDGAPERLSAEGPIAIRAALDAAAVRRLFVSERFLREQPEVSERLVRDALGEGGAVQEVRGPVGDMLDATCVGVAARLRFWPSSPGAPTMEVPNSGEHANRPAALTR